MAEYKSTLRGPSVTRREQRLNEATNWIELDLPALDHNTQSIRTLLDAYAQNNGATHKPKFCAIVKKNAYGCGAPAIAGRLAKSGLVDMLGVFDHEEAIELIDAGIDIPIFLMMPFEKLGRTDGLYRHAVSGKLHISIHDSHQAEAIKMVSRELGMRLPLHINLDTGMCRGGFQVEELRKLLQQPHRQLLNIHSLYTHFGSAGSNIDGTTAQLKTLQDTTQQLLDEGLLKSPIELHAANTPALFRDGNLHLNMVRAGIGLHGFGQEMLVDKASIIDGKEQSRLHPIMTWKSRLIHISNFPAGRRVGYGGTYELTEETPLGLIPVGYGDGYPVSLSNKGIVKIWIDDETNVDCQVVGKVNMDQIIVDLSPALKAGTTLEQMRNAEVDIISADPSAANSLIKIAELANASTYAILAGLSTRIPRHCIYH